MVRGLVVLIVSLLLPVAVASATDPISVTVVPAQATLTADEATTLLVVVANGGTRAIDHLRLMTRGSNAVGVPAATVRPASIAQLAPGAQQIAELTVEAAGNAGTTGGTLSVVASYRTGADGDPVPHAVVATVTLARPTVVTAADVAALELNAPARMRSGADAELLLSVTSRSPTALTVSGLSARGGGVTLDAADARGTTLAPGATGSFAVTAKVPDRVASGAAPLQVSVDLRRPDGTVVTATATRSVEFGVTGESALLTILGVPVFAFAPGLLILGMFSLLWQLRVARRGWSAAAPVDLARRETLIAGVALSLVLTLVTQRLTGVDLFGAYSFDDIAWLWVVSLLLGLCAYLVYVLARNRAYNATLPTTEDEPLRLLGKLQRQGLTIRCPTVGSGDQLRYVVSLPTADEPTWLASEIECRWQATSAVDESKRELERALDADASPQTVRALLETAQQKGAVSIQYVRRQRPTPSTEKLTIGSSSRLISSSVSSDDARGGDP